MRSYLPLIHKDSSTHIHGLSVYVKEGLPFTQDLSLENSADSYLFSTGFTSLSLLYFSSIGALLSNIDEVHSINPSANVFVFGDFDIYLRDWLTYSSGTDQPGELCYVSMSNDLTQMVNFPIPISNCDSQSCSFGFIYFF